MTSNHTQKWGRGTGENTLLTLNQDLLREGGVESNKGEKVETGLSPVPRPHAEREPNYLDRAEFEEFIKLQLHGQDEPHRAELERWLRANRGADLRDFKGKGVFAYGLDCSGDPFASAPPVDPRQIRNEVVGKPARYLSRLLRQAAARDAALIWNPLTRWYRRRAPIDPAWEPVR